MKAELGDFQTPPALIAEILKCLSKNNKYWERVFEPTCGRGNFISGLLALDQPPKEIQAIEFDTEYFQAAKSIYKKTDSTHVVIQQAKIFDLDLGQSLKWSAKGNLLVIGNPPWVTNSQLGSLGSNNLPIKTNFKGLKGLEALTGSSNFDITEYIWIKLIQELVYEKPTIALLCKTAVARNVLQFAFDAQLKISNASIRLIDAKKWFKASVSACLFCLDIGVDKPSYQADVYSNLSANQPESTIGIIDNKLVADIKAYQKSAFLNGSSSLTWRQGLKHDAASVIELTYIAEGVFQNKFKQIVDVESGYIYPLLKSTDLFHGKIESKRGVIVTQKRIGEDTNILQQSAPRLWQYLESHSKQFDKRKSSIYKNKPPFSIFGIGDYSFSLYKVAISGLHKQPRFRVVHPINNRPVMLDDTCYFIPCNSMEEAVLLACLFNSDLCLDFIKAITFLDAKRPITKKLLQSIDLDALLNNIPQEQLIEQAISEYQRFKAYSDRKIEWLSTLELLSKNISTVSASVQSHNRQLIIVN
ncbi:SAM-dependent methyltransferase [Calothrix sp. CCY 0018]|uniref:SAM-dependent methyltransferase n=1 Tax=Calothrix sp. CCY 0018 TaxID=3103864 RepID=UPI0039C62E29